MSKDALDYGRRPDGTEIKPFRGRSGLRALVCHIGRILTLPHYYVFLRSTDAPIKSITRSATVDEARPKIIRWCSRKTNEANYVQVAGAVMFASVVSCLGWDAVSDAHWSGPALWYASILFALASIFSAAQQTLVLPTKDAANEFTAHRIEEFRRSLCKGDTDEPSLNTLFAWQAPIMLLGHSVAAYVIGMCSVVITPLARDPAWNASAKTFVLFGTIMLFIAITAAITTRTVHNLAVGS